MDNEDITKEKNTLFHMQEELGQMRKTMSDMALMMHNLFTPEEKRTRRDVPPMVYTHPERLIDMNEAKLLTGRSFKANLSFLETYDVPIIPKGSYYQVRLGDVLDALRKHYAQNSSLCQPQITQPKRQQLEDAFLR